MNFFELRGQTLTKLDIDIDDVRIETLSAKYLLTHQQDCCESVTVVKVEGDPVSILNSPIILAEEDSDEIPNWEHYYDSSHTWTSFRLVAENGKEVKFWFLGQSNGYYSESVDFCKI